MSKRKSWFDIVLIGFIVLLVLMVVGYVSISTVSSGRARSELDKIRARGEPVTVRDLVPKPIPDSVNAAVVYQRVFARMDLPTYKSDSSTIGYFTSKEERDKKPQLWADAKAVVQRQQQLLDTIADATKRPMCQFPVDYDKGFAALFPHYGKLREVSRLVAADALVKAGDGDFDGVTQSIATGIRVSESIKDDPVVIAHLVRIAVLRISMKSLKDALDFGSLNESQARQLDAALARIGLQQGFVKAMQGERAMGLWGFDEIRNKGAGQINNWTGGGLGLDSVSGVSGYLESTMIGSPILQADKSYYLRYMTRQIDLCREPYWKAAPKLSKMDPSTQAPSYAVLTSILAPVFGRARTASTAMEAEIAVARAALGLMVYKDRYGAYPQTLAEMKSKLGWVLPKDPCCGKDLKYKRTSKGFVVYSVGTNMVDEGGKVPDPKGNDSYSADVVWELPAK